jgi:hypothetical protein
MKTIFCSTINIGNLIISVFEPEGSENEEEYKKIHDEYKNLVYKRKFLHKKATQIDTNFVLLKLILTIAIQHKMNSWYPVETRYNENFCWMIGNSVP